MIPISNSGNMAQRMDRATALIRERRVKGYEITKWRNAIFEAQAQGVPTGTNIGLNEDDLTVYLSDNEGATALGEMPAPFFLEDYDVAGSDDSLPSGIEGSQSTAEQYQPHHGQPQEPPGADREGDPEWEDEPFGYAGTMETPIDNRLIVSMGLLEIRARGGLSLAGLHDITTLIKTITPELAPYDWRTTELHLGLRTGIEFTGYDVCRGNCFCYPLDSKRDDCPLCSLPRYKPSKPSKSKKKKKPKPYIIFNYISYIDRLRLQ